MTEWWRRGVIYQVYPRSFADADGDGVGDLAGIIERLDHLRGAPGSLGVDALWLSPIYPSPLADFGYDVSNYTEIDPVFGDLATFDRLVASAHRRGLRVLLDLIPGHTSVEHSWFLAARASRSDPHRDWYIWADSAPDGGPPNNWLSVFGGPAWELDGASGQYYLHSFYPEQPDLNWRNPALVAAFHDVVRFWRSRGVDGFRIDAIDRAIKDPLLRDNPPAAGVFSPRLPERMREELRLWNKDRPEVLDVVRTLRRAAESVDHPPPLLIGESYIPIERMARYLGDQPGDVFDLVFDFDFLFAGWEAPPLRASIESAEALLPEHGWPCRALSSHDVSRHATRFGAATVRAAALLLLTLRGTPAVYMGEEIGMLDTTPTEAIALDRSGRDASRSPMHWDASSGGGFSAAVPWLALGDTAACNVADQRDDPNSLLALYRRLIALRHESDAIGLGAQRSIDLPAQTPALAFLRQADAERVAVVVNVGAQPLELDLVAASRGRVRGRADVRLSTSLERTESSPVDVSKLALQPHEGLVLSV
ncbi:MAG: alpha-amylase family glycosyl hydrolase [Chloroflexota bacterium]|nr:alpha-amylase family glycosyl hydrolase [Chloroflexota bacterium]